VLHASALGKVLLAAGVAPVADVLEAPTRATIVEHDALERELALVRERGYATSIEELEPGLLAVAAGVRERSGAVIAALAISGPSIRLEARNLDRLGTLLVVESRRALRASGIPTARGRSGMNHDEILQGLYDQTSLATHRRCST